jgi:hypothetical protein
METSTSNACRRTGSICSAVRTLTKQREHPPADPDAAHKGNSPVRYVRDAPAPVDTRVSCIAPQGRCMSAQTPHQPTRPAG